eukprot:m.706434 g.706434  ORF g.706434 m.706434 type:complete len:404 (-) comp22932_c0_seq5:2696-3907(-)
MHGDMGSSDRINNAVSVAQTLVVAFILFVAFIAHNTMNTRSTTITKRRNGGAVSIRVKEHFKNTPQSTFNSKIKDDAAQHTHDHGAEHDTRNQNYVFGFYLDYANDEDHFSTKKGTTIQNVSEKILLWVESAVNVSSPNTKIILVHNYENVHDIPLLAQLASMEESRIALHYIDPRFDKRFNEYTSAALAGNVAQRQSPHTIRYLILEVLLQNIYPCEGYCIVTDITDVQFQSDPFEFMAKTDAARREAGLPQPAMYIGDQPDSYKGWIYTSMPRCFPDVKVLRLLENLRERDGDTWLNNGLIGGTAKLFYSYIGDLAFLLRSAKYDVCDMAAVSLLQVLPPMPSGGLSAWRAAGVPDLFIGLYNRSTSGAYSDVHGMPYNCKFSMSRHRKPTTESCVIRHKS